MFHSHEHLRVFKKFCNILKPRIFAYQQLNIQIYMVLTMRFARISQLGWKVFTARYELGPYITTN